MEDQQAKTSLQAIIIQLKQQFIKSHFPSQQEHVIAIDSIKEQEISLFFKNDKKVLLAFSRNSELASSYFKHLTNQLWKQEQPRNIIPLYIELSQLRNPFDHLIEKGLTLYGITREQQDEFLKSNPIFVLTLIGYDQLETDRPHNLYVANKLERFNIQKIIITCHSDYVETRKNYRLFFASYQNKEPQYDKFQEINLDLVELTSSLAQKELLKRKPVDDDYWHKILMDDLEQLLHSSQEGGYKQPPTLQELQVHPLNKRSLVKNIDELSTRADCIREMDLDDGQSKCFRFKQLCFLFLRYSKQSDSVKVGAANAITILNKASISFAGMDFSNIYAPQADLSRAILSFTSLKGANLQEALLTQAYLGNANFSDANLEKANFGEYPRLELENMSFGICYSKDGKYLAVATRIEIILFVHKPDGFEKLISFSFKGCESQPVAFSPDGKFLAAAGSSRFICLWDVETHQQLAELKGHTGDINSIVFSPDGMLIASMAYDRTVRLWNVVKKIQIFVLKDTFVAGLTFSPDGKILSYVSRDKVCLWDIENQQVVARLSGLSGCYANSLSYSPKGNLLAAGSPLGKIYLWNVGNQTLFAEFEGHNSSVKGVAFSLDGKFLISGDSSSCRFWDVENNLQFYGELSCGHTEEITDISLSPDDRQLATTSRDGTARIFDIVTIKEHFSTIHWHTNAIMHVAISLDGKLLASSCLSGQVFLWDLIHQKSLGELKNHYKMKGVVVFSPNGKLLASVGKNIVNLWEVATQKLLVELKGYTELVTFSPDGKLLASKSEYARTVKLWDIVNERELLEVPINNRDISSLSFSPNGEILAYAGIDDIVEFWDVIKQKKLPEIAGLFGSTVTYSPEGNLLAYSRSEDILQVWDIVNQKQLMVFNGFDIKIFDFSFCPEGKIIACGTCRNIGEEGQREEEYQTVFLWDVNDHKLFGLNGHFSSIWTSTLSSGGKILASGGSDMSVLLWKKLPVDSLKEKKWIVFDRISNAFSLFAKGICFDDAKISTQNFELLKQQKIKGHQATIIDLSNKEKYKQKTREHIGINPLNPKLLELFLDGNYSEILKVCDEILTIDANHLTTLIQKSCVLMHLNKMQEAIICCDKVLELNRHFRNGLALRYKGAILFFLGRLLEAKQCFEEKKKISNDIYAICYQGYIAVLEKNYDVAFTYFNEANQIDATCFAPLLGKGLVAEIKKQPEVIKQCYNIFEFERVNIYSSKIRYLEVREFYCIHGITLIKLGCVEGAYLAFERGLQLKFDHPLLLEVSKKILLQEHNPQQDEDVLSLSSFIEHIHVELLKGYLKLARELVSEDIKKSISCCERAIELALTRKHIGLLTQMQMAYFDHSRYCIKLSLKENNPKFQDQAKESFKHLLDINKDFSICVKYANFLVINKQFEMAIPVLNQAIELKDTWYVVYEKSERDSLPEELQYELVAFGSLTLIASPFAYYLLGLCYKEEDKYLTILSEFEIAIKQTHNPINFSLLAYSCKRYNLIDKAINYFESAVKMESQYELAKENLEACKKLKSPIDLYKQESKSSFWASPKGQVTSQLLTSTKSTESNTLK